MERLKKYLKEALIEMKKVTWPTRRETYQYTVLVIAITLGVAAFTFGLDYFFNVVMTKMLNK